MTLRSSNRLPDLLYDVAAASPYKMATVARAHCRLSPGRARGGGGETWAGGCSRQARGWRPDEGGGGGWAGDHKLGVLRIMNIYV